VVVFIVATATGRNRSQHDDENEEKILRPHKEDQNGRDCIRVHRLARGPRTLSRGDPFEGIKSQPSGQPAAPACPRKRASPGTRVPHCGNFGRSCPGFVNALFTAAAFAGVIFTILLQRRELSLQRFELELTRHELKRSAQAQENSEKALQKQAESLLLAAQLNALVFRINVYDTQINELRLKRRGGVPIGEKEDPVKKMEGERFSLYLELDDLRKRARSLGA